MPRIQRPEVPEAVLRHLFRRRAELEITTEDLKQFAHWLDQATPVPDGEWFMPSHFSTNSPSGEANGTR